MSRHSGSDSPAPVGLQIATGDPRPIFRQIVDEIRMKVALGELRPGARLPSVRSLAVQLTVNPNTVAKAYAALTAQGFLESRRGLGIFVKERSRVLSEDEQDRRLDRAVQSFLNEVVYLDIPAEQILEQVRAELDKVPRSAHERKGQDGKESHATGRSVRD